MWQVCIDPLPFASICRYCSDVATGSGAELTWNSGCCNLINQRSPVNIVLIEHEVPDLRVCTVEEVASLRLEHAVLVCNVDKLEIILTLLVGDVGKVRVPLLAVLSDN
jgi:hypothetical protein